MQERRAAAGSQGGGQGRLEGRREGPRRGTGRPGYPLPDDISHENKTQTNISFWYPPMRCDLSATISFWCLIDSLNEAVFFDLVSSGRLQTLVGVFRAVARRVFVKTHDFPSKHRATPWRSHGS